LLVDLNHNPLRDIKVLKHAEISLLETLDATVTTRFAVETVMVTAQGADDESVWVKKAQASDSRAFEALYRLHVGKIYGLCLRMTGNASEAEDCTQEAFIQAWSKMDKFRGDSSFGTWMHKVAVNSVLGRMRKARREQDRIRVVGETTGVPESIGDSAGLRDLELAINELPSGARHVFVLQAVYGYTHEETGSMLGIAAGTSKAQLHRARRLLAQQLESSNGENGDT
jgi:RNA polymerase sigma-70 factor (ECF subfamily)